MCSRFSLASPPEAVRRMFDLVADITSIEEFPPRYNIAPTQPILVIRQGTRIDREAVLMRWGLIPGWVKDPKGFATLINARAETVAEKPSFRAAFRHRRCLIPADGFYEWTGPVGAKQPHLIRLKTRAVFGFAGLFETWMGSDGSEIDTATIITTAANADVATIHDRMPVILPETEFAAWLDCRPGTAMGMSERLQPLPIGRLDIVAVDRRLNNSRFEGADVQLPLLP